MIILLFCLTGELDLILADNHQKSKLCLAANTYGAHYAPGGQYIFKYPLDKHVQIFQILFPYQAFIDISGKNEMTNKVTQGLQNLAKKQNTFFQIKPITQNMHLNISQMLNTSLHGADQNFFFIARIFDLFNSILSMADEKREWPAAGYDTDHAEKARMILETRLENPPSVSDLAGMVGVSPAKLKQIFPKVYGMPPYCYLRKLRMEKAMGLLNSGQMNVTETAYEVGYNSLSHFAGLFARHFGIKPSEVYKISEKRPPALTPF